MADFNKVLLMGNLTRDPEVRYSGGGQGGTPICKFGLAVNRRFRTQAGEQQEDTCFVDVVVFGRQGETCAEYLGKGRPVFVEGRLSFSSWEDRESGQRRSKLEVIGERVQFLGSRGDNAGGGGGGQRREYSGGGGYQQQQQQQQQPAQQRQPQPARAPSAARDPGPNSPGIDYDDIPF